ncbi:hypothetical protein Tco_1420854, partial [Tanacetum coccineum]
VMGLLAMSTPDPGRFRWEIIYSPPGPRIWIDSKTGYRMKQTAYRCRRIQWKKKKLKEASESGSNSWPLDDSATDEDTDSDLDSTTRSEAKTKNLEDTCESSIIMVNVIPPDHVDYVPVVEPNQHDDVPVVPEPVLVDEEMDPEEEEFKEEEEHQEEAEDDMEVDIEEYENESELTYPYEEVDPLNPPPPASDSGPENVIKVEDMTEFEDETVPVSVHEVGESSTVPFLQKDSDGLFPGLMRRDINLFLVEWILFQDDCVVARRLRSSVEQGTAAMEKMVEKLGNAEENAECKKLKNELEEARFSNTFLRMQNERVERDLYWTRVRAHEFYREMIRRRSMFEERLNEAIDVLVEDEKSPSSEPRGSPRDSYVDAVIAVERARHANVGNDARGSGLIRGQDAAPVVHECTFAGFMKCNPTVFHEGKKVKFAVATLQGPALTWCNAKVATMGLETVN